MERDTGSVSGAEALKRSDLPLKLTVRITATNGATTLKGVEAVLKQLLSFRFPKLGQVFEGQFWRAEVIECVDSLFGHWQPMETAPKTDRLLLCIGGNDWAIGSWNRDAFDGPRWEDDGLEPMAFIVQPTHWMPLPYLPPWSKWPNDKLTYPANEK